MKATHLLKTSRQAPWLAIAVALATLIKLWLAWKTQGTLDIPAYQDHLDKIRQFGVAAYGMPGRFGNPFNIPPFALHLVQLAEFLADKTGVQFRFWFRLPGIAADAGSVWLAWKIVSKSEKLKLDPAALLLMALCPASITIAGFHGNLDPIMVFFVLLSLFLLVNNRSMGWAAAAFGMAMNIKVAPLLFAPSLFFYLPNLRARLHFFSRAFAVCLAGSLPYVIENPLVIATAVLGHAGMYSHWGWSLLLVLAEHRMPMGALSGFHPPGWHGIIAVVAKYLVLILVVIISYWMNRKRPSPHLFVQFGAVAFLFMFLTPGFGAQYLCWLVPWIVALGWRPAVIYFATSGAYLIAVYSCVSLRVGCDSYLYLGLVCWVSILPIVAYFIRAALIGQPPPSHGQIQGDCNRWSDRVVA